MVISIEAMYLFSYVNISISIDGQRVRSWLKFLRIIEIALFAARAGWFLLRLWRLCAQLHVAGDVLL